MINGVLNIYKEKGFTSHDVVAKLRGICKQKKIGHTGTLDPDAEGVLPVCLGNATKLCDMLTDKSKEYEAEFLLGVCTDTQDISGKVVETRAVAVTTEQVEEAVYSFQGEYDQIPPMYSAIKMNGKRLYELAREGKVVERKARRINIYEIQILSIALPKVRIRVQCSKGTYIRTLCVDIGEKLGCGATMTKLLRTRVDSFHLGNALKLSEIEQLKEEGKLMQQVIPVDKIFSAFPSGVVKKEFRKFIDNGNRLYKEYLQEKYSFQNGEEIRIYNDESNFCGIYYYDEMDEVLKPVKMFPLN